MGYVVTSPGLLDRLLHGPPAPPPKGVVLVVSASSVDVTAVRQTVTPRGYNIVVAGNADDGIAHLQNKETNIGFIVIDGGIAEAKRLMDAATGSRPEARQIVLTGSRQIGDVSNRLIDAGIR